jgi:hypothetical protein
VCVAPNLSSARSSAFHVETAFSPQSGGHSASDAMGYSPISSPHLSLGTDVMEWEKASLYLPSSLGLLSFPPAHPSSSCCTTFQLSQFSGYRPIPSYFRPAPSIPEVPIFGSLPTRMVAWPKVTLEGGEWPWVWVEGRTRKHQTILPP